MGLSVGWPLIRAFTSGSGHFASPSGEAHWGESEGVVVPVLEVDDSVRVSFSSQEMQTRRGWRSIFPGYPGQGSSGSFSPGIGNVFADPPDVLFGPLLPEIAELPDHHLADVWAYWVPGLKDVGKEIFKQFE